MEDNGNKVLMIPPTPPKPYNTLALAIGGLVLSLASVGTYFARLGFPHGAVIEPINALVSSWCLFAVALVLGLLAATTESKRNQYKDVVLKYTRISGDKRYLPYIITTHTTLVSTLFLISMTVHIPSWIDTVFYWINVFN
jgi:hypothetical protein